MTDLEVNDMKKTAVLMALLLLLSILAPNLAKAETAPLDADPLLLPFPESIPWDSSEEEILAGLGRKEEKPVFGDHPDAEIRIYQFPASLAEYPAEFGVIFWNAHPIEFDALIGGEGNGSPVLEQVLSDLTERYGAPNSENFDLVIRIVEATGGAVDQDAFETSEKYLWELPDERTVLFLVNYQGIGLSALDRGVLS